MKDNGRKVVYEDSDYQAKIDWESMYSHMDKQEVERRKQLANGKANGNEQVDQVRGSKPA